MRLLVISDCHGDIFSVRQAIQAQPTAHIILFLGDGLRDIETVEEMFPKKIFVKVAGNCDWNSKEYTTRFLERMGKKIMLTHGHGYQVKHSKRLAVEHAKQNGCDLLLFGHTHTPITEYDDGLYIMNPGSISKRNSHTYGTIDLEETGIFCNIIPLS